MNYSKNVKSTTHITVYLFGLILGLMPTFKFVVPLFLIPVSIFLGLRKITIDSIYAGSSVIIFCILQLSIILLHPDNFSYSKGLFTTYLLIGIISIPFCNILIKTLKHRLLIENAILQGAMLALILLGLEALFSLRCNVNGIGVNALLLPLNLVPIVFYFIFKRFLEKRNNYLDLLLIFSLIFGQAIFIGSRMSFYVTFAILLVLILACFIRFGTKLAIVVSAVVITSLGISLAVDSVSNCGFKERVVAHKNAVQQISGVILDENNSIFSSGSDSIASSLNKIENSSRQRAIIWDSSRQHLLSDNFNWLIGNGRLVERQLTEINGASGHSHVHNQYLSWLIQGGLLGILSVIILCSALLKKSFKNLAVAAFLFCYAGPLMTNSGLTNEASLAQFLLFVLFVRCLEYRKYGKDVRHDG